MSKDLSLGLICIRFDKQENKSLWKNIFSNIFLVDINQKIIFDSRSRIIYVFSASAKCQIDLASQSVNIMLCFFD